MAKLPEIRNLTLLEVDKALEEQQKLESKRHYLGMSEIGEECWRKLFYNYRYTSERIITASGIKAIKDGFAQEDIMAERLRLLPYIKLHTVDPNNPEKQIGFSLILDHFKGHCDGMILGIKEAPTTWHVWENKAVNQAKFNKLNKLIDEKGEKNTLIEWDIIYYGQAQIYMHCSNTIRHYLTVQSPGGREYISCRTEYNKKYAESIIEKAKTIITDNWNMPAKVSDKREFYKCNWCHHQGICHDGEFPLVHCKTCRYCEPIKDGQRKCLKKDEILKNEELHLDNCSYHVYNPALVPAKCIEQQEDCCIYETSNNFRFANCEQSGFPELKDDIGYIGTSTELFTNIKSIHNFSKATVQVQKTFEGEIESKPEEKAWDKKILMRG